MSRDPNNERLCEKPPKCDDSFYLNPGLFVQTNPTKLLNIKITTFLPPANLWNYFPKSERYFAKVVRERLVFTFRLSFWLLNSIINLILYNLHTNSILNTIITNLYIKHNWLSMLTAWGDNSLLLRSVILDPYVTWWQEINHFLHKLQLVIVNIHS